MIEFIEEGHFYLIDGIITPSVSDILKFIFPSKYDGVPINILNAKANYGSIIHECIECMEQNRELPKINYIHEISIEQYEKLKQKYEIEVITQEQLVNYQDKYCGRFDMIANVKGDYSLCDIKTTAKLDEEYLSWQLSFYALAFNPDEYENTFKKFYAIWLPKKGLGEIVEIARKPKEQLLKKLEEFYENYSKN